MTPWDAESVQKSKEPAAESIMVEGPPTLEMDGDAKE